MNKNELREAIIAKLKEVYDPEIPVSIYELGLVYEITINDDFKARILMTLTAPNCPVAESLPQEVKETVMKIEGITDAEVEITFDPPWDEDMMSEEAKLEMGLL
jgi:FeS assembly SUF system protein